MTVDSYIFAVDWDENGNIQANSFAKPTYYYNGNCYILEPNFAPDPDGKSDYGNPYLFTGRRVDILDANSLKIQYNRNRYYDQYTGRWLTHEPLGITPNARKPNRFALVTQYIYGLSLYEYLASNPLRNLDPFGLKWRINDFVRHYCGHGFDWGGWPRPPGSAVDLGDEDVDLMPEVKRVANPVVANCKGKAENAAQAAGSCCFTNSVFGKCGGYVDATRVIFALGNTYVHASYNCSIERDWRNCSYKYTCTINFWIKDRFEDPVDVCNLIDSPDIEIRGCTPYDITASWSETVSGRGTFRGIACLILLVP